MVRSTIESRKDRSHQEIAKANAPTGPILTATGTELKIGEIERPLTKLRNASFRGGETERNRSWESISRRTQSAASWGVRRISNWSSGSIARRTALVTAARWRQFSWKIFIDSAFRVANGKGFATIFRTQQDQGVSCRKTQSRND